jgi:hypothetical protein
MICSECPREQDVLDAVQSRRWPNRASDELRAHVVNCDVCADLAVVAGALLDGDEAGTARHEVPPASLVWWRAQLRAREEAAQAALRPIRVAQLAAWICVALLLLGTSAALASSVTIAIARIGTALAGAASALASIDTRSATDLALAALANRGVQLAAAVWLVLGPVAAYLAFSRD